MSRTTSLGDLDDLAFAQLLADTADWISLDLHQGAELMVVTKPDRSEVSEADLAVDAALRRLLHTHRPEQVVDVAVRHDSDRTCDLAAPMLLVTEAGGMLTDPAGQPWTEGSWPSPVTGCCTWPCWPPSRSREAATRRHGGTLAANPARAFSRQPARPSEALA